MPELSEESKLKVLEYMNTAEGKLEDVWKSALYIKDSLDNLLKILPPEEQSKRFIRMIGDIVSALSDDRRLADHYFSNLNDFLKGRGYIDV
jgi:hypothetical protein